MIVDVALYERGRRVGGELSLAEMVERGTREPDAFVWIGLFEPTDEEFDEVEELFDLHPLAIEDAVHAHQRPKLERYGDSSFLVMQTVGFGDDDDELDIGEVMVFLGDGFIVTVRHGEFNGLAELRRRLEADPESLVLGASSVLYAVADRVVDEYEAVLDDLEEDVLAIERNVFTPGHHDLAERIYRAKREVQTVRRAVTPLREVMRRLAAQPPPVHVDPELHHHLRDVFDHVIRARERLAVLDELLTDALSANMAQIGLRQNEDMRRISAWVGIVAVPTMIAGVYGMNFEHMPELEWRIGYPLALVLMFAISFGLYRAFKRSGWL